MHWLWDNRQWIFSGAGVTVFIALFYFVRHYFLSASNTATTSVAVPGGRDAIVATGSKIQQTVKLAHGREFFSDHQPVTADTACRDTGVRSI